MSRLAVLLLLCCGLTAGTVGATLAVVPPHAGSMNESAAGVAGDIGDSLITSSGTTANRESALPSVQRRVAPTMPEVAETDTAIYDGTTARVAPTMPEVAETDTAITRADIDTLIAPAYDGTTARVAPTAPEVEQAIVIDSLFNDSLELVAQQMLTAYNDTAAPLEVTVPRERWVPNPKKALWLAIVFPGGGQIYNRKYWKLPLFYGGFVGCLYAMNWNNTMYHDYSQAYLDIMDDDDNSVSYMNFLPSTYDVESNLSRLQSLFKKKKDYYRRYRDLSFFCLLGVYALSILDAYIDAELSSFDISRDLTMKVRPSVITDHSTASTSHLSTLQTNSYGVQCAIQF